MIRKRTVAAGFVVGLVLGGFCFSTFIQTVHSHEPDSDSHLDLKPGTTSSKAAILFQGNLIADIAERAAPAVVKLEVDRNRTNQTIASPLEMPGFNQFQLFFNGKQINSFRKFMTNKNSHNSGSGFIIRKNGYILTNAHVVKDADKITVQLNDKKTYPAKIIGKDTFSDLAVIKIDVDNLPTLKIGSSTNLRPGEFVIAIGSPLGYDQSVTLGIISAVEREVTDISGNINFIQTDAAINRGNSGGPLINLAGEVIGVNTALRGDANTIGFSIPANVAKSVSDDLIEQKKILRPYLGIGMEELSEALIKSMGLKADASGVLIRKIYPGSPAEQAGLKTGDLVLQIEGTIMNSPRDIKNLVKNHKVGETLGFSILRNNEQRSITVPIGEYPDPSIIHNQ